MLFTLMHSSLYPFKTFKWLIIVTAVCLLCVVSSVPVVFQVLDMDLDASADQIRSAKAGNLSICPPKRLDLSVPFS